MVTKVLDDQGNVLHDCAELGCEISWDGFDLVTGAPAHGRSDPDAAVWTIDGDTARPVPDEQ